MTSEAANNNTASVNNMAPDNYITSVPGWLVRESTSSGVAADQPDVHGHVEGLVDGIAEVLRRLHETAVDETAVDPDPSVYWQGIADQVSANVESGVVDPSRMSDPYSRYTAQQLHEMWLGTKPATHEVVLCHGNPRLASFFFEGPTFVGCDDVASIRLADRHLDLAIVHHEIHHQYGPEAVFRFYESYGQDPDLVRLDHYILASMLLEKPATETVANQ